jgi:TPR repeat protein
MVPQNPPTRATPQRKPISASSTRKHAACDRTIPKPSNGDARPRSRTNQKRSINLGVMYEAGQGAPQDYVQAHRWFNLAASRFSVASEENRLDAAARYRDIIAAKMTPDQIAEAQRLARERKPTK